MKFRKIILSTALAAITIAASGCGKNESVIYIDTNSVASDESSGTSSQGASSSGTSSSSNSDIYQLSPPSGSSTGSQRTDPVETQPVETTPIETTPVESTPAETTPVEAPPAETPEPPADTAQTLWTETPVNKTMYVRYEGVYSRPEAVMNAEAVNVYYTNETVNVVAYTDTDYYKLDDGNFIHSDYLSDTEVTPTVEDTADAPDDGNADDGNVEDGNVDDGNVDDENADDGNADDGNVDDGGQTDDTEGNGDADTAPDGGEDLTNDGGYDYEDGLVLPDEG